MKKIEIIVGQMTPPSRARPSLAAAVLALVALASAGSAQVSMDWSSADPVLQLQQRLAERPPAVAAPPSVDMTNGDDLSPEDMKWVQEMSVWTEELSVAMMFAIVEEQAAYLEKLSRKFEELRPLSRDGRLSGMPDWSLYEDLMPAVVQLKGALAQARAELGTDPVSARRHLAAARSQAARLYALSRPLLKVADAPRWGGPEIKRQAVIFHIFLPAIARKMPADAAAPSSNSGYGACLKKTGYGHGYCRGAKGGYQDCLDNGYDSSTCKGADLGYRACIANGHSHSTCLDAKGGYQDCLDGGYGHSFCRNADAGFKTCVAGGRGGAECRDAKGGYAACLAGGLDHSSCLDADLGYKACRGNGRKHSSCKDAREGYGDCIATGYSHNSCT